MICRLAIKKLILLNFRGSPVSDIWKFRERSGLPLDVSKALAVKCVGRTPSSSSRVADSRETESVIMRRVLTELVPVLRKHLMNLSVVVVVVAY